ncbi:MAG: rhamnulokinase [Anaerolineales bacterium]|nr:rhamnulokinase [Anaerolineales bacterium]
MKPPTFLAIDLGAASGRVIVGTLNDQNLQLTRVHRFPDSGVRLGQHLYWDFLRLWSEIKKGLWQAGNQFGQSYKSIGLDSWGVDFGLLDASDCLIQNPYHYRDSHTDGMMEAVFSVVSAEEVFSRTGNQLMQINSLYQLYSMVKSGSPALSIARTFLNIPDLFNFFLTGEKASEFSIASTTQCFNPVEKTWALELLSSLGIPTHIFGEILPSGTVLGPLQSSLAAELGLNNIPVVAVAGHDTASAVAAVPATDKDYIYLSSGTWSLMGVELDTPMLSPAVLKANMTNEGGYGNKTRFLQNIVGLWMLQECRRQWSRAGVDYDYDILNQMAAAAPAFGPLVNPGDSRFLAPEKMVEEIQSFCSETGQEVPTGKGAVVRCVLESLAMEYRWAADQIDRLTGKEYPVVYIIGGGSKNQLLNQFASNATGKTVIAGLEEATAIGNILVQAIAVGEIVSLAEGREIVRQSFPMKTYEPKDTADWEAAYSRYKKLRDMPPRPAA